MSQELYEIHEHVIPTQHLREYHFGQRSESDALKQCVREYRPRNNPEPDADSVTIIFAHGNSDPGQCYEPVFDDILRACRGVKIRAIWSPDAMNKGRSAVLNEHALGDDPSPLDSARDYLYMVNHFRERMVRPIVGIGHSSGCLTMIELSTMHTRLFHSLVLMEPIFPKSVPGKVNFSISTSRRRDLWPSRAAAEEWFRKNPYFGLYESRMLDAYLKCHLRETPTAQYPAGAAPAGSVTLTTPKAQDVWSMHRPHWTDRSENLLDRKERLLYPNVDPVGLEYRHGRPECQLAAAALPTLKPGVLWIYGADSEVNPEHWRRDQTARTGTAYVGSGGAELGLVRRIDIAGAGHILPQMKPKECADAIGPWLAEEVVRFKAETEFLVKNKPDKSKDNMTSLSDTWMREVPRSYEKRSIEKTPKPAKL